MVLNLPPFYEGYLCGMVFKSHDTEKDEKEKEIKKVILDEIIRYLNEVKNKGES